jgi:hypothetical protein
MSSHVQRAQTTCERFRGLAADDRNRAGSERGLSGGPDDCVHPERARVDAASRRSLVKGAAALGQMPTAAALLRVVVGKEKRATATSITRTRLSGRSHALGVMPCGSLGRMVVGPCRDDGRTIDEATRRWTC